MNPIIFLIKKQFCQKSHYCISKQQDWTPSIRFQFCRNSLIYSASNPLFHFLIPAAAIPCAILSNSYLNRQKRSWETLFCHHFTMTVEFLIIARATFRLCASVVGGPRGEYKFERECSKIVIPFQLIMSEIIIFIIWP